MPVNLAAQKPLENCIFDIEINLDRLGLAEIHRDGDRRSIALKDGRLVVWAIAALERQGIPQEKTLSALCKHPSDKQWLALRRMLSEEAIRALDGRLIAMLENGQENAA